MMQGYPTLCLVHTPILMERPGDCGKRPCWVLPGAFGRRYTQNLGYHESMGVSRENEISDYVFFKSKYINLLFTKALFGFTKYYS